MKKIIAIIGICVTLIGCTLSLILFGTQGEKGETGNGIVSIELTGSDGLIDTYTVTFTDKSTTTFTVTNGKDAKEKDLVSSVKKTSTNGLIDTYTIYFADETTSTFTVTNGAQGAQGEQGIQGKQGIQGRQGEQGIQGEQGNGIASIDLIETNGLVDTYSISFTNGSSTEFTVTNGEKGAKGEKGEQGIQGKQGIQGLQGKTTEFRVDGDWLQWKYTDEENWKNLFETDGTPAPEGLVYVKFVLNGGAMPSGTPETLYVTAGSSIGLPTPIYNGYSFDGWYIDTSDNYPQTSPMRVHESIKLYAKWVAGTKISGKKIYNLNDLANIKNNLGGTYILMNDIDCKGLALSPLGSSASNPFTGVFDGQGYTLKNYKLSISGDGNIGLFGYNTGTVKNLKVEDVQMSIGSVTATTAYVGYICGFNGGNILQCSVISASISTTFNARQCIGLISGYNSGSIKNCMTKGTLNHSRTSGSTTSDYGFGGIIGINDKGVIDSCLSHVTIQVDGSYGDDLAGGIAGVNSESSSILNCVVFGSCGSEDRVGDIVGICENSRITNCYADEEYTLKGYSDNNKYYSRNATAMGIEQFSDSQFYYLTLGWDSSIWDCSNVKVLNGIYPKLSYDA